MLKVVSENSHYRITIDQEKNWIITKPIGFWRSPEVVPNYLNDIENAVKMLMPKFMVIIDASDMLTHPKAVQEEIHLKGMKGIKGHTPSALTVVMPYDEISVMQAKYLGRQSGAKFTPFRSMAEAERYLEEYAKEHLNA